MKHRVDGCHKKQYQKNMAIITGKLNQTKKQKTVNELSSFLHLFIRMPFNEKKVAIKIKTNKQTFLMS